MKTRPIAPAGTILVIVLWVLTMLGAIGLGMAYRTGLQLKRVQAIGAKTQSLALCQAAIQRFMFEMAKNSFGIHALSYSWSNDPALYDHYRLQTGTFTISYERPPEEESSQPLVLYGAMDEESLINVNSATKDVWERLLKGFGIAPDLHEAVLDWVDADSNTRFQGAEAYDYSMLEHPYTPRNGKMALLEELLLVKGITPQIYQSISPYLTVWGEGRVNINTACGRVLEAAGLPEDLVEKILRFRRGLDDREGTGDDGVFYSVEEAGEKLSLTQSVSNADRFALNNIKGSLTVCSRYFRIHAVGESISGIKSRVLAVVENPPPGQITAARIRVWKEE